MPKLKNKVAAVIDIGSSDVKLQVSQLRGKQIVPLSTLEYPLKLGHEVFCLGKISFECLRELSHILTGFAQVMREFGVQQYRAVGTTALREARNREFILDQLLIQNRMAVEILDDGREKSLIYSAMTRALRAQDAPKKTPEQALLAYIGTGSIGISLFNGSHIFFTQNISTGSLKLHDILGGVLEDTDDFAVVVEEYLDSVFTPIALPAPYSAITKLVLSGSETQRIARLCNAKTVDGSLVIKAKALLDLYRQIRLLPLEKLALKFNLSEDAAEMLYSSLAIYAKLLKFTGALHIVAPKVELWDSLLEEMLLQKNTQTREHALACAVTVAKRYRYLQNHADFLRALVCSMFDKLKALHGLSPSYKLLLEVAAILHDSGFFINAKHHLCSNAHIVKYTDIYGLSDKDTLMAAYICRFNEMESPDYKDAAFSSFTSGEKIIALKLAAIFRLACALDISQKQKMSDIKMRLDAQRLLISAKSDCNTRLELWAFEKCAAFFKEVFGILPVLTVKLCF